MRILYGVQGTGHGHLVRSAAMVAGLRALDHEVHCLLSGRDPATIAGVERFAPYTALRGFTGTVGGGRVRLARSVADLRIPRFFRDVREFETAGFDLVVTDYEPASAWIARRNGLPSLGLGHLYAFRRPLGLAGTTLPAEKLVGSFTRIYTPVRQTVGLHWDPFGGRNLPPSIPPEVHSLREPREDTVLLYLPAADEEQIVELFACFPDRRCIAYRNIDASRERGNVLLRPYSREGFVADLADAASVITNAGFSLPSEALHLGRRLLAVPIRRHPEQFLNGRALRTLGLGTVTGRLDPQVVRAWLATPRPAPKGYPDVIGPLVRWIDGGDWGKVEDLVEEVWSRESRDTLKPGP